MAESKQPTQSAGLVHGLPRVATHPVPEQTSEGSENDVQPAPSFRMFLRSIGLGIIGAKPSPERPKAVVHRSRIAALAASGVHIIPTTITITLVVLNIGGRFIGGELQGEQNQDDIKMGLLQVAAKVQELLIMSSLGAVILNIMRMNLVFMDGIPLGFIGADKAIAAPSFFWSLEFWGAARSYRSRPLFQGILMIGILIIGGIMALLAGPATAILMIPREMPWPAGGAIFWLNGSAAELWPNHLSAELYSEYPCTADVAGIENPRCPSGGFMPLFSHLSKWRNYPDSLYKVQLQDYFLRKSVYVMASKDRTRDTWTYLAHTSSGNMQDSAVFFYRNALWNLKYMHTGTPPYAERLDLASVKRFSLDTKVPAVRAACVEREPLPLVLNTDGPIILGFPQLLPNEVFRHAGRPLADLDVGNALRDYLRERDLVVTEGSSISLSEDINADPLVVPLMNLDVGEAAAMSLVILQRRVDLNTNQTGFLTAVPCTIDARWAKANTIFESKLSSSTGELGQSLAYDFYGAGSRNVIDTELHQTEIDIAMNEFSPLVEDEWQHISLERSWYDLLSPVVSDSSGVLVGGEVDGVVGRTLLERLVALGPVPSFDVTADPIIYKDQIAAIEVALSMFFADGISRVGAQHHLETWKLFPAWPYDQWHTTTEAISRTMVRIGEPEETFPLPEVLRDRNATRMVVKAEFTGFVMSVQSWFDIICVIVLLLHAVIALAHTVWSVWYGEAGEAWDTIPELVALCSQSAPAGPDVLDNTSAGIRTVKTMKSIAKVEAQSSLSSSSGSSSLLASGDDLVNGGSERLQLRFRSTWGTRDSDSIPSEGKLYGISND